MIEVQAQGHHCDDVEQRHVPHREARHDVVVDGQVPELAGLEADHAARQVQQVIDDEEEQDDRAPAHRARRVGRRNRRLGLVPVRARGAAHAGQLNRGRDMQRDAGEEDDADDPEHPTVGK